MIFPKFGGNGEKNARQDFEDIGTQTRKTGGGTTIT